MTRRTLTDDELADAERLYDLYKASKLRRGLTQSSLADAMSMTQSAVSKFMRGDVPLSLQAATAFANILDVNIRAISPRLADQVAYMTQANSRQESAVVSSYAEGTIPKFNVYPLIDWDQLAFAPDIKIHHGPSVPLEMSDYRAKGKAFWLQQNSDSMASTQGHCIARNSLMLVDTGVEPVKDAFVIAILKNGKAVCRMYVEDGSERFMKPLNPLFRTTEVDNQWTYIGTVVRVLLKL
ncbi:XRE family transcriptional regulator [Pseudomonas luteola]